MLFSLLLPTDGRVWQVLGADLDVAGWAAPVGIGRRAWLLLAGSAGRYRDSVRRLSTSLSWGHGATFLKITYHIMYTLSHIIYNILHYMF